MGWIKALRHAEQEGTGAAKRGFDKTRTGWEDVERRIRRKMRIFPGRRRKAEPEVPPAPAENELETADAKPPANPDKRAA